MSSCLPFLCEKSIQEKGSCIQEIKRKFSCVHWFNIIDPLRNPSHKAESSGKTHQTTITTLGSGRRKGTAVRCFLLGLLSLFNFHPAILAQTFKFAQKSYCSIKNSLILCPFFHLWLDGNGKRKNLRTERERESNDYMIEILDCTPVNSFLSKW